MFVFCLFVVFFFKIFFVCFVLFYTEALLSLHGLKATISLCEQAGGEVFFTLTLMS